MRILVADDDAASRRLLMATLSAWGYEPIGASDGDEAAAILAGGDAPLIAILDWEMPGRSGPEICRDVRKRADSREASSYAYILLVTGRGSRDDLIGGLDAGADDYLVKPVDPREMKVRLRAGRRIVDLQRELLRARDELEHRATHDALTGVWNRAGLMDRLSAEVARSHRDGRALGVAVLDLDHFKSINDTKGHGVGDDILREVGRRLPAVLRPYDFVGRYGGEEFLLILPGASQQDAHAVAERVRAALCASPFVSRAGPVGVTASIGTASLVHGAREDADALVGRADAALYEAKRLGRNRVASAPHVEPTPLASAGKIAGRVRERLRDMLGDDSWDEIASLIDDYVVSAVREVHAMKAAATAGNLPQMRRHAHALKGASANFGVDQVATLAAEVESSTTTEPAETLERLGKLVEHVMQELRPAP